MRNNFEDHLNNVFSDLGEMLKGLHIPSHDEDEDAINFISHSKYLLISLKIVLTLTIFIYL